MQDCCGLVMAFSPFAPKALTCEAEPSSVVSIASGFGMLVPATLVSAGEACADSTAMASTLPLACHANT